MFLLYDQDERAATRWETLADECRRRLSEQQIAPGSPGTILKDVDALLEFVGTGGVLTKSRNATLPADRLPELNARSSHPLELALKRPLLRDYPNLAGLFVLLRVMDLLQMQGHRLTVPAPALEFWRGLNPAEQYFALLEALLFEAQPSVLGGERNRREETQAFEIMTLFLRRLSERWLDFDRFTSIYALGLKGELPPWNLFLQQQLGLIELRQRVLSEEDRRVRGGGRGWLAGAARLTPWGTAVTWALLEFLKDELWDAAEEDMGEAAAAGFGQGPLEILEAAASPPAPNQTDAEPAGASGDLEPDEKEWDEASEESAPEAGFGILQPVFQPYFPEWQRVYARPAGEARTGTHVFKVSFGGWRGDGSIWRRLAVPAGSSLDVLAGAILKAFKFDDDHLYDFRYRDQRGRSRVYNRPYTDEGPFTTDIAVGDIELALKDEMLFTFDYGDNWQFKVRLERIDAGRSRLRQPKVIESAGKAPKQYGEAEW